MTIIKDKEFEDLLLARHLKEMELNDALIKAKDDEILIFKNQRDQVQQQFEQNLELQKSL